MDESGVVHFLNSRQHLYQQLNGDFQAVIGF